MKQELPSFQHGVVAGKFYPLHLGHDLLIRTALQQCEQVTILLIPRPGEIPDGPDRLRTMRLAYPTANVLKVADLGTDDSDPLSSILWAKYTRDILDDRTIDAVYTSEHYGESWAAALGSHHVMVDLERSTIPVSGTQIRANPFAYWDFIHPEARWSFVKRVLLIGPESTGKTTLAARLAERFGSVWVPEYGRMYVEKHGSIEETDHRIIFAEILNRQPAMEDALVANANRVLFCDTDLTATYFWYFLWQPDSVGDALHVAIMNEAIARRTRYDLVLITSDVGAPWVDDGLRDQMQTRRWFTEQVVNEFRDHPNAKLIDAGSWQEREAQAVAEVSALLRAGTHSD